MPRSEEYKAHMQKVRPVMEQIEAILRDNQELFQPRSEEPDSEGWTVQDEGPFLFNQCLIVISFLDNDNDEWIITWRPQGMTHSNKMGMLYQALHT